MSSVRTNGKNLVIMPVIVCTCVCAQDSNHLSSLEGEYGGGGWLQELSPRGYHCSHSHTAAGLPGLRAGRGAGLLLTRCHHSHYLRSLKCLTQANSL